MLLRVLSYLSIVAYCFFALTVQCCELTICSPPPPLSLSLSRNDLPLPLLRTPFWTRSSLTKTFLFFENNRLLMFSAPRYLPPQQITVYCQLKPVVNCVTITSVLVCAGACVCSKEPLRVGFCAKKYVYHYYYVIVSASVYILTYFLFT